MATLRERGVCKRPRSPTRESYDSNPLVAHNEQHRMLHLILTLLLAFCLFLILSLCSPDLIGIDDSFQAIYYPTTSHLSHFLLVYGPMINKESSFRSLIRFTPKSAQNGYVLHDHFDPENDVDSAQNEEGDALELDSDSELTSPSEFAARVHHLRRSFSFDTALLSDGAGDGTNTSTPSNVSALSGDAQFDIDPGGESRATPFTALGVQLDGHYDITVNGVLLRIDEDCLFDLDSNGADGHSANGHLEQNPFSLFRREQIPLQWIHFLYSKPREFESMKQSAASRQSTASKQSAAVRPNPLPSIKSEDIENANSMMHQDVDVELEEGHGRNGSVRAIAVDHSQSRNGALEQSMRRMHGDIK